jgi:hypothetical protein
VKRNGRPSNEGNHLLLRALGQHRKGAVYFYFESLFLQRFQGLLENISGIALKRPKIGVYYIADKTRDTDAVFGPRNYLESRRIGKSYKIALIYLAKPSTEEPSKLMPSSRADSS